MANSLKIKLRTLRETKRWSLDKLADATGISKSYLWELENRDNGSPSAEKLARIAEALDVTSDFLLDDERSKPSDDVVKEAFFRKFDRLAESDKRKINEIVDLWSKENESP